MNKNGFTLVELLAVIVILAVILVIAVPKITSTINSTRKAAFESSARMIAGSAETWYQTRSTLGLSTTSEPPCTEVTSLSADFGECTITFDANGTASVALDGATDGKFNGCSVTGATKTGTVTVTGGNCAV